MTKQFKTAINNKLKNIDIPGWVKYIATDANGEVWGFELKPSWIIKGAFGLMQNHQTHQIQGSFFFLI